MIVFKVTYYANAKPIIEEFQCGLIDADYVYVNKTNEQMSKTQSTEPIKIRRTQADGNVRYARTYKEAEEYLKALIDSKTDRNESYSTKGSYSLSMYEFPAFPTINNSPSVSLGLSKREYIATHIAAGICSRPEAEFDVAERAIYITERLMEELNK